LYTKIYCGYAKCKSILHVQIFKAMQKSTKCGKFASNWKTTEIWWQRKSKRHVKWHRKQTLAEITNSVNDVLPQPLSSRTARRRLRSCGFAKRKIWKQIVIRWVSSVIRFQWSASSMQIFHILSIFPSLQKFVYARLTYI